MGQTRKLKQGYLLLLVIGLIGVIFTLGLAVVQFMTAQRQLVRKAEDTALARESSRAGVNLGLAQLRRDPEWKSGFQGVATVPGTVANLTVEAQPCQEDDDEGQSGPLHLTCQGQAQQTLAIYEALVYPQRVLLDNDFSRDANEWQQPGSMPVVLLGYYTLNLGLPGDVVAGQSSWTDYEAEFVAILPQATSIGLLVRASEAGAYLVDYSLMRGSLQLSKVTGSTTELLSEEPRRDLILPHTFTILADRGDLTISLDGQPALTYHDPDPLTSGRIGIRPRLGTVTLIDRVTVRSLFRVVSQWRR